MKRSAMMVQESLTEKLLRRQRISVLLANYGQEGVKFLSICKNLGIPLITHFHGFDAHTTNTLKMYGHKYQDLGRNGNRVIAVSQTMKRQLSNIGIPEEAIFLIRYGVDTDRFHPIASFPIQPVFLSVGRFVDKKAPYLTLLAFQKVAEVIPGARLVFIGSGDLMEVTRNLCFALNLQNRVDFLGSLRPEEVATQMRAASAFVQHSVTPKHGAFAGDKEGTPVAVLEAMMIGLPIVASKHSGIGEVIIHNETGLLFEEHDVGAMTRAMLHVARNPELAHRLGKAARKEATTHYASTTHSTMLRACVETTVVKWKTGRKRGATN